MAIAAALVGARGTTSGTSVSTTSGTTTASGSTFVLVLSWDATSTLNTPVTDSKGNTYTAQGTPQNDGGAGSGGQLQIFVCQNGTGGATHSITCTFTAASFAVAHLIEVTGAATSSLDQIAQIQDAASPWTVTSPTLSQANEVVIAACAANINVDGSYASSNFTILSQEPSVTNFWTSCVGSLVVASTSAVTPSFTNPSRTGAAAVALATFKEAAAASGGSKLTLLGVG